MIVSNILKSNINININIGIKYLPKYLPKYSYGRFLLENPRAEKKDRVRALQEFLNKTR